MTVHRWSDILASRYTPEEIAELEAQARRGVLIAYAPDGEGGWIARALGDGGRELRASAASLREARRLIRGRVVEAFGDVLEYSAETLPLGADDEDDG